MVGVFALVAIHRLGIAVLRRLVVWAGLILALAPCALWYNHAHGLYLSYGNSFGIALSGDTKWGDPSYWLSLHFYLWTFRLEAQWVWGGLGVVLVVAGLIRCVKDPRYSFPLFGMAIVLVYYFLIARAAEKPYSIHYHILAVPFAAMCAGIGWSWLHERLKSAPVRALILSLCAISYGAISIYWYVGRYSTESNGWAEHHIDCASIVKWSVPETALIIVSSQTPSSERSRPKNYQNPIILFYSKHYGWSLPSDWHTPEKIDSLRREGAEYLVTPYDELLAGNRRLAEYLETHAEAIGPGTGSGCSIFRFRDRAWSQTGSDL
jgi:hypothetical protein